MAANIGFKDLSDFSKRDANLRVTCARCKRTGVLDAAKVYRWFVAHCWNTASGVLHLHLRCRQCKGRPSKIEPCPDKPDRPKWMDTQDKWTQLTRRLRN